MAPAGRLGWWEQRRPCTEGRRFDPWAGRTHRLWVHPESGVAQGATDRCFSLTSVFSCLCPSLSRYNRLTPFLKDGVRKGCAEAVPARPGRGAHREEEMAERIQAPRGALSRLRPWRQAGAPGRGSCQGHADSAPGAATPDGRLAGGARGHGAWHRFLSTDRPPDHRPAGAGPAADAGGPHGQHQQFPPPPRSAPQMQRSPGSARRPRLPGRGRPGHLGRPAAGGPRGLTSRHPALPRVTVHFVPHPVPGSRGPGPRAAVTPAQERGGRTTPPRGRCWAALAGHPAARTRQREPSPRKPVLSCDRRPSPWQEDPSGAAGAREPRGRGSRGGAPLSQTPAMPQAPQRRRLTGGRRPVLAWSP